MPTQQVDPESAESLQDVANALLKARKVVVVTGAGISTNSGIPDFRSENGLYSLIQAQFDAASRGNPQQEESPNQSDDEDEPSPKRRRITRNSSVEIPDHKDEEEKNETEQDIDSITVCPSIDPAQRDASKRKNSAASLPSLDHARPSTPKPFGDVLHAIPTSPLSSPPVDAVPPSVFRNSNARYYHAAFSSSPLSSPPPILFDPWASSPPGSDTSPSRRSSTTPSEMDDTCNSNLFSSQSSNTALSSLPNMKGKDLFDASIWADPLRTQVFYTFATSLKQKIKDCEPTSSHHFISHLRDRGKLVRCYTQNIDRIEEKVGLSTSLEDGPGARGRFSRKSTNASQLAKMVELESRESTESQDTDGNETPTVGDESMAEEETKTKKPPKLERSKSSGVECVFLHGSLESLRCFLCGRISSWNDSLEGATLSGQQPECPHCIGATVAREERGKRALGVGKLRPDIVLYGEEHPNAHLISPIVTHDLGLCPDVLLILGTSLRVHGLKIMVREFAKSIHNRGGKVIFVNFTKPPESIWGDIIDYWVQWDCDAWVSDLRVRIPKLWEDPPPPKKKKTEEEKEKEKREKPPAANPVALRDTRVTGAYWSLKIRDELFRITGTPSLALRAYEPPPEPAKVVGSKRNSLPANQPPLEPAPVVEEAVAVQTQVSITEEAAGPTTVATTVKTTKKLTVAQRATSTKPRRSRKSAPGALERPAKPPSSTLNPAHGRSTKGRPAAPAATFVAISETKVPVPKVPASFRDARTSISSILNSVKENPRVRKRKKLDGEEVVLPTTRSRANTEMQRRDGPNLTLAPLTNMKPPTPPQLDLRPRPMEPESPPTGPILRFSAFSSGISSAFRKGQQAAAQLQGFLQWGGPQQQAPYPQQPQQQPSVVPGQHPLRPEERDVAMFMADMKTHNDFVNMR